LGSSGSVRGEGGNLLAYSKTCRFRRGVDGPKKPVMDGEFFRKTPCELRST
jgi:hypothetical protein